MDQSDSEKLCSVCNSPASSCCSHCKRIYYCGKEHQASDWKVHKNQCFPKDGTVLSVTGILFAVDEDAPRLVKVNYTARRQIEDDDDSLLYYVDFEPYLGKTLAYGRQCVFNMGCEGPKLKHPISLYIRDNYLNDGSKFNRSISNVANGRTPHEWRGNVLGMKQTSIYGGKYLDASMDDMPAIITYLQEYGMWS